MGFRALRWLESQWPYAALLCAVILLLIVPVWYAGLGLMFTLIYLQIPVYMLHQFEEHDQDRFRRFANAMFDKEVFTPLSILVINSLGVWGVDIAALLAAYFINPALGLIAAYLPVINGISHIAIAVARRGYNPGLVTSLLLFLPIGGWTIWVISSQVKPSLGMQLICIGVAILIHAGIMIYVRLRLRKLG